MTRTSARLFLAVTTVLLGVSTAGHAETPVRVWEAPILVASGEAYRGPWRMNASKFHFIDDATVAINDAGVVAVAWADQSKQDIYLQVYEPDGSKRFEQPVNVSRTPRIFSWLPRMVIVGDEPLTVFVLWQEIVFSGGSHGGEIFFARSNDGGRSFNGPINLSNSIPGDGKGRLTARYWDNGSLDLAIGSRGTLYAVWTEYEGTLWFSRSTDGGGSFTKPLRIAGAKRVGPARGPSLAVDTGDVVYVAWAVGEDLRADIQLAKSTDAGRSFDTPRVLFKRSGHDDAPKVAVDPNGTVHLVFAESPDGPFQRHHIRYTHSTDGARTFERPRDISSPLSDAPGSSSFPSLSVDGEGNLYVLWEIFPNDQRRPRGLGFTISKDTGKTFAPPTLVPRSADPALGDNGGRQGLLMRKLAVNKTGDIAVVNNSFKQEEASYVWLLRGHRVGH